MKQIILFLFTLFAFVSFSSASPPEGTVFDYTTSQSVDFDYIQAVMVIEPQAINYEVLQSLVLQPYSMLEKRNYVVIKQTNKKTNLHSMDILDYPLICIDSNNTVIISKLTKNYSELGYSLKN